MRRTNQRKLRSGLRLRSVVKWTTIGIVACSFILNFKRTLYPSITDLNENDDLVELSEESKTSRDPIPNAGQNAKLATNDASDVWESPGTEQQNPAPDTTIIILSSLIPTHPSIQILNETFHSLSILNGLPANTPILISVDGLPTKKNTPENISRLHKYVKRLRLRFRKDPHVTIINNYEYGHISNSIKVALEIVETKFIYVLQHDFKFVNHVNHTALVNAMEEHPNEIQCVRFGFDRRKPAPNRNLCKNVWEFNFEQIHFHLVKFSDNNHFTTKAYYETVLQKLGPIPREIEAPMDISGKRSQNVSDCAFLNQYQYNWKDGPFIRHLDGKLTLPTNETELDSN